MANITLNNVPEDLLHRLRRTASKPRRRLNQIDWVVRVLDMDTGIELLRGNATVLEQRIVLIDEVVATSIAA